MPANKKFKEVIKNLEENISNKQDLLYAKSQMSELIMTYIEELEKLEYTYKQKIEKCLNRLDELEAKMTEFDKIENEFFEETDFSDADLEPIKCPYCDINFYIEFDETRKEMQCPACNNIIELDWGNFEDDM